MKKLIAVVLVLSFGVAAAQTPRSRPGRNQSGSRRRGVRQKSWRQEHRQRRYRSFSAVAE